MRPGAKPLRVNIPNELHTMLKKTAIDHNITISKIIIDYLLFLNKFHHKTRRLINEKTGFAGMDVKNAE